MKPLKLAYDYPNLASRMSVGHPHVVDTNEFGNATKSLLLPDAMANITFRCTRRESVFGDT